MARNRLRMCVAAIGFAALAMAPFQAGASGGAGFEEKFKPGDVAPEVKLNDLDGKPVVLSAFKGKNVVVLNFWGLRCGACIEEIPYLEDMHARYKAKGVVFYGIDTDGVGADIIKGAMKDINLKVSYPILADPDFAVTDVYTNYLVPLTIIIDRKGVIRYVHTGFEKGTEKKYEEVLKKVVEEAS